MVDEILEERLAEQMDLPEEIKFDGMKTFSIPRGRKDTVVQGVEKQGHFFTGTMTGTHARRGSWHGRFLSSKRGKSGGLFMFIRRKSIFG
jgi:hypothetical protein